MNGEHKDLEAKEPYDVAGTCQRLLLSPIDLGLEQAGAYVPVETAVLVSW